MKWRKWRNENPSGKQSVPQRQHTLTSGVTLPSFRILSFCVRFSRMRNSRYSLPSAFLPLVWPCDLCVFNSLISLLLALLSPRSLSFSDVLKQQGHTSDVNTLSFSPDGQLVATGGADGKLKLWNTQTGFCFVTFAEHTAPITCVQFSGTQAG